jgi:copper chaperone CopZ
MESLKFRTDIKCSGCIAKVTPFLNEALGAENWQVDIADPSKVLTVTNVQDENEVKSAVSKAGYKAERIL